jgi:hypothetical protein
LDTFYKEKNEENEKRVSQQKLWIKSDNWREFISFGRKRKNKKLKIATRVVR